MNKVTGPAAAKPTFTGYQKFVVGMLGFLQFTLILDFMIMAPLGAFLMPALKITPEQFSHVVSIYAFSAGVSGLLAAGFADRFDRKKLLLFFYVGFLAGTALCGVADTYEFLLLARMVTGLFGGVIGSIVMAIVTDLFPFEMRGRVMGILQTAFAASQVLGLPAGVFLSNHWGWHAPFYLIAAVGAFVGIFIQINLKPIDEHLKIKSDKNPLHHLIDTVTKPEYLLAFCATGFLSIGGFMMMPFGSAFSVHNLQISFSDLPIVYLVTGIASIFIGPFVGRASDYFGKFKTFLFGTIVTIIMVLIYTNLGPTPLALVILVNSLMFVGIFSRMIPSQALMSAIPSPASRGSFMSVSSSLQQIAGGFASILAGYIVLEAPDGSLLHFDRLGYVMLCTVTISVLLMYQIHKRIQEKTS